MQLIVRLILSPGEQGLEIGYQGLGKGCQCVALFEFKFTRLNVVQEEMQYSVLFSNSLEITGSSLEDQQGSNELLVSECQLLIRDESLKTVAQLILQGSISVDQDPLKPASEKLHPFLTHLKRIECLINFLLRYRFEMLYD